MKIEEIKTIVKLMSENDLTEFKIEAEDMHLCIKRGGQNANPEPEPASGRRGPSLPEAWPEIRMDVPVEPDVPVSRPERVVPVSELSRWDPRLSRIPRSALSRP